MFSPTDSARSPLDFRSRATSRRRRLADVLPVRPVFRAEQSQRPRFGWAAAAPRPVRCPTLVAHDLESSGSTASTSSIVLERASTRTTGELRSATPSMRSHRSLSIAVSRGASSGTSIVSTVSPSSSTIRMSPSPTSAYYGLDTLSRNSRLRRRAVRRRSPGPPGSLVVEPLAADHETRLPAKGAAVGTRLCVVYSPSG